MCASANLFLLIARQEDFANTHTHARAHARPHIHLHSHTHSYTHAHTYAHAHTHATHHTVTTLRPHLGIVDFPDNTRLTIADIPGLVEGITVVHFMCVRVRYVRACALLLLFVLTPNMCACMLTRRPHYGRGACEPWDGAQVPAAH